MIANKFPNLDDLQWSVKDNEKLNPLLRQQTRFAFAEAFSMIPYGLLKQISLQYFNQSPNNQELNSSSALIPSCPQIDHLSLALYTISQAKYLTHLDLGAAVVISPSLFWPETQIKPPSWPNLVSVELDFSMNTADGDWYFVREDSDTEVESNNDNADLEAGAITTEQNPDPDIPDTYNENIVALATGQKPYRHYRIRADPGKLNPLFVAAAKAAACMPRLQRMSLSTVVKGSTERRSPWRRLKHSWGFTFAMTYSEALGERTGGSAAGSRSFDDVSRLDWAVGLSGYEPEESILELWRLAKGEVVQTVTDETFFAFQM
ncbi:MAG: hypothetical protein OHK93_007266 [Ramalina farinacea]|uniref:Uncharacterized protein n=1 Tax=Ramalina farinacea TaxID=258253 RepID=A0AA43QK53_9LECA|nr:hypothetical protein [Ramalina farinacea]